MNAPAIANTDEIPSLLIPMMHCKLILPAVSVAEMVPYQLPQERHSMVAEDLPDWYLGNLAWRGISIPMVSFELLNAEPAAQPKADSHIVILNNTGASPQLKFICMATQGIPRLNRVAFDDITEVNNAKLKKYWQIEAYIAGEKAVIPDLEKIEKVLCNSLTALPHN